MGDLRDELLRLAEEMEEVSDGSADLSSEDWAARIRTILVSHSAPSPSVLAAITEADAITEHITRTGAAPLIVLSATSPSGSARLLADVARSLRNVPDVAAQWASTPDDLRQHWADECERMAAELEGVPRIATEWAAPSPHSVAEGPPKLIERNTSTEEGRQFWASAEASAAEVETWPAWRRAGIIEADSRARARSEAESGKRGEP